MDPQWFLPPVCHRVSVLVTHLRLLSAHNWSISFLLVHAIITQPTLHTLSLQPRGWRTVAPPNYFWGTEEFSTFRNNFNHRSYLCQTFELFWMKFKSWSHGFMQIPHFQRSTERSLKCRQVPFRARGFISWDILNLSPIQRLGLRSVSDLAGPTSLCL